MDCLCFHGTRINPIFTRIWPFRASAPLKYQINIDILWYLSDPCSDSRIKITLQ